MKLNGFGWVVVFFIVGGGGGGGSGGVFLFCFVCFLYYPCCFISMASLSVYSFCHCKFISLAQQRIQYCFLCN